MNKQPVILIIDKMPQQERIALLSAMRYYNQQSHSFYNHYCLSTHFLNTQPLGHLATSASPIAPITQRIELIDTIPLVYSDQLPPFHAYTGDNTPKAAWNLYAKLTETTAIAKAYEQIYDYEKRYRILMNNARCGIFILNQHGKIIEVNKQAEKLFDCDNNEIKKNNFIDYVADVDKKTIEKIIKSLSAGKVIDNAYLKIISKENVQRSIEISGTEVKAGSESVLMIITTDITDKDKMKSKAILNDKLATVGTLAAGVAHEINNPISWVMNNLTVVKSLLEANNKQLSPAEIQELRELVNDSLQGVERVKDIVRTLKEFSRVDSGTKSLVDIHKLLESSITMATLDFKYHARLERHYSSNMPPIMAQAGKLQQVFLNLIINASQAMAVKNAETNVISITTRIDNEFIRVDVADTGHGIPPNIMPHIFDPFFTTKETGHGTGLGLSICREIITQCGGHISVTSTPKNGATFSVFLPLSNKIVVKVTEPKESGDKKNILIVDDEPFLVKSLLSTLKNRYSEYNVITAPNGRLAAQTINYYSGKFHVIICDLQMPDMNGYELYQHITKNYERLRSSVIFITGGSYTPRLKDFLQHVNNPVLEKPFTQDVLFQAIERCLSFCGTKAI